MPGISWSQDQSLLDEGAGEGNSKDLLSPCQGGMKGKVVCLCWLPAASLLLSVSDRGPKGRMSEVCVLSLVWGSGVPKYRHAVQDLL